MIAETKSFTPELETSLYYFITKIIPRASPLKLKMRTFPSSGAFSANLGEGFRFKCPFSNGRWGCSWPNHKQTTTNGYIRVCARMRLPVARGARSRILLLAERTLFGAGSQVKPTLKPDPIPLAPSQKTRMRALLGPGRRHQFDAVFQWA